MGYCNINGKTYQSNPSGQAACNASGGTYSDIPSYPLDDVPQQQGPAVASAGPQRTSYIDDIKSGALDASMHLGDLFSGNVELPGTKAERIKASRQSNVPSNLNPNHPDFGKFTLPPAAPQVGPANEAGIVQPSDAATGKKAPTKEEAKKEPTFLENIQNKEWWMESLSDVQGDNRLSRIARGMAYISTPLSKRGENPQDILRKQILGQESLKASQDKAFTDAQASAAGMQVTANKDTIEFYRKSIPDDVQLERELLESPSFLFGLSEVERKAKAAQVSRQSREVMFALAKIGVQPTMANVRLYLEAKKRGQ